MKNGLAIAPPDETIGHNVSELISSLGTGEFGKSLVSFVHRTCGADHCSVFEFHGDLPLPVLSLSLDSSDIAARQGKLYIENKFWRVDPTIDYIRRRDSFAKPVLIRRRIEDFDSVDLRNVVFGPWKVIDRAVIFGSSTNPKIGLTVSSSAAFGTFTEKKLAILDNLSGPLLAIVAKHLEIRQPKAEFSACLRSLDDIESLIIASAMKLTAREAQVCARIIYGLSSFAIASDLKIGEESVMTYRKRAYQRLRIATQRELMLWYIDLFERSRGALTLGRTAG